MAFWNFLDTIEDITNTVGGVVNTVQSGINTVKNIKNTFDDFIDDPFGLISTIRRGTIPPGAEPLTPIIQNASFLADNGSGEDWRVRIHIPASPQNMFGADIFTPLRNSNNSMVFPTTPQILVTHSANYSMLSPIHTNYPYPVYQNSQVEDITITGEFPVENEADGRYWISSVHFLRTITKMFYGNVDAKGAPPPRVALSGYGDFIFQRTPVIVKMFSVDLPRDVDYIKVPIAQSDIGDASAAGTYTYVPTLSTLNITVQPVYSRDITRQFNLTDFASGAYITDPNKGGFI